MSIATWIANTSGKASASPLDGDEEIRVVDDPGGTPASAKVTVNDLRAVVETLALTPSSDQDNYDTGADPRSNVVSFVDLAPTASIKITGIDTDGFEVGKRLVLRNTLSLTSSAARMVLLERSSGSSSAANRFNFRRTGVPLILLPEEVLELVFDGTDLVLMADDKVRRRIAFDAYWSGRFDDLPESNNGTGADQTFSNSFQMANGDYETCSRNQTGTDTNGWSSVVTNQVPFRLLGGSHFLMARLLYEDLASVAQDYSSRFGRISASSKASITNGVYFEYERAVTTDWQFVSVASSTETRTTITGATVGGADVAQDLGIFVNGDGSRVEAFYSLDYGETWEVNAVAHTTNIPSSEVHLRATIQKTAGTTSRDLYIPFIGARGRIL